jgi:hypothetical protein
VIVYGVLGVAAAGLFAARQALWNRFVIGDTVQAQGRRHVPTVDGALAAYGRRSENKFRPACRKTGIVYPPKRVTLVAFKEEKQVEVWGANASGPYKRLAVYPVLAASGTAGPKRKSGDRQVPEGFYRISALNPASRFHLSLRVDYPNAEDIAHRTVPEDEMGNDIYVHGNAVSIGCLAMGDPAIEEMFCLVARAAPGERRILIAPKDVRSDARLPQTSDRWVQGLYRRLQLTLRRDYAV